jgi:hypothetical protein
MENADNFKIVVCILISRGPFCAKFLLALAFFIDTSRPIALLLFCSDTNFIFVNEMD